MSLNEPRPLPAEAPSRERLLAAGKTLFAAEGYENTTTSAIARLAGTSESQLIKHFGSKEGLLQAILEAAWEGLEQELYGSLNRAASGVDRLRALADVVLRAFESDPELRTLMLLEGRRIRRHGHMVILTQGFLNLVRMMDATLLEMQTAGELRSDLHLEAVRSAIIGAFEGLVRDQILAERRGFPAHYDSEELRRAFDAVLWAFVRQPTETPLSQTPP